jgi:branched-chain amino acid transport system permease protein
VSAAMAAAAGCLYAQYVSYVDPTSFTLNESILLVSMVVLGGLGSTWGAVVGALVLVMLPEALRFVGLPSAMAANIRQFLYGAALVGVMLFRPRGLMGRYGFGR